MMLTTTSDTNHISGICVVVGAFSGAYVSGFWGFVGGAIAGIVTPAGLLKLGLIASYVAIYLACFGAAWLPLFYVFAWLFGW